MSTYSPPETVRGNVPGAAEMNPDGSFNRVSSIFRSWVANDPTAEHPAQPGRYHLYVGLGCPWASRTVTVRALKGLEDVIGLTVVDPIRNENGWAFRDVPGATADPLNGWSYLAEGYETTQPGYDRRVSVPVLWDAELDRIVNNESADIIVMLDGAFNEWASNPDLDLYPTARRAEIDELNEWIYAQVNNGVYMCGFAETQAAYDRAIGPLFEGLDRLDALLADRRYLTGAQHTLADWRLFPTLVRFDPCYHGVFRCNRRRIVDYPNLWPYLRDLYQTPGVAATVNFDHIIRGYHNSPRLNPTGIVPIGPDLELLNLPHSRAALG